MHNSDNTLVLVDGSSYLFRAFHAMPSLTNSSGNPTGAVYGVLNMLRRLIEDYQPRYLGVVFDAKGKTFRDDWYPDYKANRPPMPEELAQQIEPLHRAIEALGMPIIVVPGVEADDVIGTLARQATEAGLDTIVSTGDKDMAQLVNDRVTLINTMNNSLLDPKGVEEKFGVTPGRIIDYLTLVGDSVDNIPGVPKVGPKTAAKWIKQYGSLDALVEQAGSVKGKVGENLRAFLDDLPLSRKLVTIDEHLDLDRAPTDLKPGEPDRDALITLYRDLEFQTWLSELLGDASAEAGDAASSAAEDCDYQTITDPEAFAVWVERLRAAELFAFDTETTGLDYMQADLIGLSFAIEPGEAAYVPLGHDYLGVPEQLRREDVLAALRPLLEDPGRPKVGQNLKYDMSILARAGIDLAGIRYDTMLESYVLDSTATRHNMDALALKYLGLKTIKFEDIAGKGKGQLRFNAIPLEQAGPYAAEDADITLRLHRHLWPKVEAIDSLKTVFEDIEIPLVPILSRIERNGVLVDAQALYRQSAELQQEMESVIRRAYELADGAFNLSSPKQIQEILYDRMGLPVLAKTPKGAPSTAEAVLQALAEEHELPKLILEHRSLSKLKSTYTDKLPKQVDPDTGRVHTSYHQAVAATGRLSSSDPNLQNIPIRSEQGRRIRRAFIAPPGFCLLAADYSQIELRIMAHLSADPGLLAAFNSGADVHRATAAEVFGVAPDEVTTEQRRNAKAINFGLIYGMSAFGLAKQLGLGRKEAQAYIDLYFRRYPGVQAYMERIREQAREQGYVETVFGRRLYLPEIKSRNGQRRQYAERTAINAPMQGTAADIIKKAMIAVDDWLRSDGDRVRMVMQVHDELVFEVPEDRLDEVSATVCGLMEGVAELAVPLVVDAGSGANWDEAH
jgi:DNA polymerase-1